VTPSVLPGEDAACGEVPVGTVVVRSGRGNKDRVMPLPKIRYRGPFYIYWEAFTSTATPTAPSPTYSVHWALRTSTTWTWTRPLSTR
jgi:hypothetical protein